MGDDNIEERISSLKSEIKSYGSDILKHISALYACNSSLPIDLKNDPRNMLKVQLLLLFKMSYSLRLKNRFLLFYVCCADAAD
jgi:hypothetical protein